MKKVFGLIVTVVMLVVIIAAVGISVSAAGNSIVTAEEIYFDETYSGNLTDSTDVYRFTLDASGRVKFEVSAYIYRTNYYIYDANGNEIWSSQYNYWNDNTQVCKKNELIDLTKGTYYFAISTSKTGNYTFKLSFTSAGESFSEPQGGNNNSILDADSISLNKTYKGQFAINDDKDLYKFTLAASGKVKMEVSAYIYRTDYFIYDANGNEIWSSQYNYWNDNTQVCKKNELIDLTKGTYYFAIIPRNGTGNYNFKLTFTDADESFSEPQGGDNNSILDADSISLNKTYKGQIAANDDKDLYKFTLKADGTVTLKLTSYFYETCCYIYDTDGIEKWSSRWNYWNETKKEMSLIQDITLPKGTYYFAVSDSNWGNYTFSFNCAHKWQTTSVTKATLTTNGKCNKKCSVCAKTTTSTVTAPASFKLSSTVYTYNGGVKTPTVTVKDSAGKTISSSNYTVTYASGRKNVGTYKVTIKMKGNYTGTKTLSFKINPVSVSKCSAKLSTTAYTYNGSVKTPSVTVKNASGTTLTKNTHYTVTYASGRKNVGTYKVTVKMKGNYSGTKTLYFKITPPKTSVGKVTPATKVLKVTVAKKTTQTTGYQIQYATSKSFKSVKNIYLSNKTTSKTITGLKAKTTYYVRVRTYKKVGSTTYCSGWSTIKYAKTK